MTVVRRCPSCGTQTDTAGECEACHEAQVRYFCSNHTPGLWLEAPVCPQCGARHGEPADGAAAASIGTTSIRVRSPAPARVRTPSSTPAPAYSRSVPPRARAEEWSFREPPLPPSVATRREGPSPLRLLGGCLVRFVLFLLVLALLLAGALFWAQRALFL